MASRSSPVGTSPFESAPRHDLALARRPISLCLHLQTKPCGQLSSRRGGAAAAARRWQPPLLPPAALNAPPSALHTAADFPPRYMAKLLKALFAGAHYALVAALAYGFYAAGVRCCWDGWGAVAAGTASGQVHNVSLARSFSHTELFSYSPLQARLHALHTVGELLPLLSSAVHAPVALPTSITAAQAAAALWAVALVGASAAWLLVWRRAQPIYLLDFECFRPGAAGTLIVERHVRERLQLQKNTTGGDRAWACRHTAC